MLHRAQPHLTHRQQALLINWKGCRASRGDIERATGASGIGLASLESDLRLLPLFLAQTDRKTVVFMDTHTLMADVYHVQPVL